MDKEAARQPPSGHGDPGRRSAPLSNDAASTAEDQPSSSTFWRTISDPDGGSLTITGASVDPGQGTVAVNPDGTVTFTSGAELPWRCDESAIR